MTLRELVNAQSEYNEYRCYFLVNDEWLNVETFKKYRDCHVISWKILPYTVDGFRVMRVIVEVEQC